MSRAAGPAGPAPSSGSLDPFFRSLAPFLRFPPDGPTRHTRGPQLRLSI